MKKQMPSTFILNANDVACFFVEGKYSHLHGPMYHVYYNSNEKPVLYNASNFVEVHGLNQKEPITKFIEHALLDLTVLYGFNERVSKTYDTLRQIYIFVVDQDRKKPKLGKYKKSLIDAITEYNELKELLPSTPEISYEENLEIITREREKEIKKAKKITTTVSNDRKQVKEIVTIPDNSKTIQRKLKYD